MTLFNNCKNTVYKIRVILRGLCSASSIFPVVYLIKTTTTTRKMEDPELKLFRMTPVLCNNKKRTAIRLGFPITTFGNDDMDGTAPGTLHAATAAMTAWVGRQIGYKIRSSWSVWRPAGFQDLSFFLFYSNRPRTMTFRGEGLRGKGRYQTPSSPNLLQHAGLLLFSAPKKSDFYFSKVSLNHFTIHSGL